MHEQQLLLCLLFQGGGGHLTKQWIHTNLPHSVGKLGTITVLG
jgi:hypothetical protein